MRRCTTFCSRNLPSSNYLHVNDERNSVFLKGTERRWCESSARCGNRCCSLQKSSRLGTSCTLVQVQKKLGKFKYPDSPQGKWAELARTGAEVYLAQKHSILNECRNFQKREWKRDGANMHFNASEASKKMVSSIQPMTCVFFAAFVIVLER